jgi:hypothetical protein
MSCNNHYISLIESLCAGVPMLHMSMFFDQIHNAYIARRMGIGRYVNKFTLQKYELQTIVRDMITGLHQAHTHTPNLSVLQIMYNTEIDYTTFEECLTIARLKC